MVAYYKTNNLHTRKGGKLLHPALNISPLYEKYLPWIVSLAIGLCGNQIAFYYEYTYSKQCLNFMKIYLENRSING